MAQHSEGAPHDPHGDHGHHEVNYTKIYLTLLVLLVISILGPELGITWVTLVTAFGIALVKAVMVIQNFMHLKWEKAIMKWMLAVSLVIVALFFFGVSPDVMRHEGLRWTNLAALEAIERGIVSEGYGEEEDHGGDEEPGDEDPVVSGASESVDEPVEIAFLAEDAYNTACATCHGVDGAGNGPGAAALDPKPASFTDPAYWAEASEERMAQAIEEGGAAVGLSQAMPAWGALYGEEQIQALVEYIETFRP